MPKKRRPGQKQRQRPTRPTTAAPRPAVRTPPAVIVPEYSMVFEPEPEARYTELLRNPATTVVRSVAGMVLAMLLYLTVAGFVPLAVVAVAWLLVGRGRDYAAFARDATAFVEPSGFLGTNLGIAALIGIVALVMVLLHRVRPRWTYSVLGRPRWSYLILCLGVAAVVLGATVAVGLTVGPSASLNPERHWVAVLVIIVLTSPLQAAGEEVLFRGYLIQAFGSVVRTPWVGVVASAAIFAALHGGQNVPLLLDRFGFGLLAGVLVVVTGGLEASIAAHVVNNLLAFGIATLTSSIAAARALSGIGWLQAGLDVGGFAVFTLAAILLARRMSLTTRTVSAA